MLLMFIAIFSISCVRQTDFTAEDSKAIFTFQDLKDFDIKNYKTKKLDNGKDYFYTKTNNKIHGYYSLYGVTLIDKFDMKIKLRTNLSIQKTKKGAIQLFNGEKKTYELFAKESVVKPKIKDVSESFLVNQDGDFCLVIRKNNLFYKVEIEGVYLKENQVKDFVSKKIQFIVKNGIGEYRVN